MRRPMILHRSRKHRDGVTIAISIAIVLAFLLPAGSAKASPTRPCICPQCGPEICGGGGGGGGNGPGHVWVTIDLFSDMAQGPSGVQVDLNGTDYVDGDAVELESGVAVSISMAGLSNVAGFYTFDDWESNVGNFTNSGATSTTFTPFHANGAVGQVAGVMNDVSPTDNTWSGYVVDEADTSTPITCVGGSLYLQPYAYVGAWPDVDLSDGVGEARRIWPDSPHSSRNPDVLAVFRLVLLVPIPGGHQ